MLRSIREQIEFLERHGFEARVRRYTGSGHVMLDVRHGRRQGSVTVPMSPSDVRGHRNTLRCARHACHLL